MKATHKVSATFFKMSGRLILTYERIGEPETKIRVETYLPDKLVGLKLIKTLNAKAADGTLYRPAVVVEGDENENKKE